MLVIEEKDFVNLEYALKTNVNHILTAPIRAMDVIFGIAQAEYNFQREIAHQKEINKINDELKTRKLLYQAILLLITEGMEEETAYNAIRAQAMASRKTLKAIAAEVIKGSWRPSVI